MKRAKRLAVALHAVSTSPAMDDFPSYMAGVESLRPHLPAVNSRGPILKAELSMITHQAGLTPGDEPSATDFVVALASFVDDYVSEPPRELFRVELAERLLDQLDWAPGRRCLTVPAQLRLALDLGAETLLDATMALHTVTRVLARGRDRRLSSRFSLSLQERLKRSQRIAPFHPTEARGGDPLGDTYHYWANVSAGIFAANRRPEVPRLELRRPAVALVLLAAPVLMSGVREGIFGNTLFYGNHARVDRMGLRHGYALAVVASAGRSERAHMTTSRKADSAECFRAFADTR